MLGPTTDGFYDLTVNADNFQLTVGLLAGLSGGLRALEGSDRVVGSTSPEIIYGNQGNDTLIGGGGNDVLFGGKENDLLIGNQGNDLLFGDDGIDTVFGGQDNDYVSGNQGNDFLFGDKGNDWVRGGKGDDSLIGGEGNDILIGDFGRDTLIGGIGDDTLILRTDTAVSDPASADIIRDFNNLDRIGLTAGLTAADIVLEPGSLGSDIGDTLIRIRSTGAILGWLEGVSADQVGSDRFVSADALFTTEGSFINNVISAIPLNSSIVRTESLSPSPINITINSLPAPFQTPSVAKPAQVIPIPENPVLQVPSGFQVNVFAAGLDNPRWLATTPTGDVLVTETLANRISLLRDTNGDGVADFRTTFANPENGLNLPFGMVFAGGYFYLGNTNSVVRFPYNNGQLQITGTGEKIADLPSGGGHWTRNLAVSPDGQKLYVSIGSASNVDPEPAPRASVLIMNLDGSNRQTFASGLRNPTGLDFNPITGKLYTVVNERDGLGDDLVPDFLTGLNAGEFYGWPYTYLAPNKLDPRRTTNGQSERPDLAATTKTPDVLFQAHSAPLGLQFYDGQTFPQEYRNGAFVALRGSWNRNQGTGYKIAFAPFNNDGRPLGYYQDFLTGFLLNPSVPTTWARPTGLQTLSDGSLLLTDDTNDRIYRIQYRNS